MTTRLSQWRLPMLGAALLAGATWAWLNTTPATPHVVMWKGAQCDCCPRWGSLLTDAGFSLETKIPDDLPAVFVEHGIPQRLTSCHVAVVDGYVISGHVPLAEIRRMLRERPAIAGLAVPGMPAGAPGMYVPGTTPSHYDVLSFTRDGETAVYARY